MPSGLLLSLKREQLEDFQTLLNGTFLRFVTRNVLVPYRVVRQHTFSEEPGRRAQLLFSHIGFDRYENEIITWRLHAAVGVRDTDVDYQNAGGRVTLVPRGRWENHKDPYL